MSKKTRINKGSSVALKMLQAVTASLYLNLCKCTKPHAVSYHNKINFACTEMHTKLLMQKWINE